MSLESADELPAAPEVISQATHPLGVDHLNHSEFARMLVHKVRHLPPGAVIGLQGSWGRGKTDVLRRICKASLSPTPVWINPWRYGTSDLLTPLVVELARRSIESSLVNKRTLWRHCKTILLAGLNFGLKATGELLPGGELIKMAADPIDQVLKQAFGEEQSLVGKDEFESDPIAAMGDRFRDLVAATLTADAIQKKGQRLIVCVDDLDRCLPDAQVALLEALHFLVGSGAAATFIVGIDPRLARQAVLAHYKVDHFDPDAYLDKMFDLRATLPVIVKADVISLVLGHLDREIYVDIRRLDESFVFTRMGNLFRHCFSDEVEKLLVDSAPKSLMVPELTSPRLVRRMFDRLMLLATTIVDAAYANLPSVDESSPAHHEAWLARMKLNVRDDLTAQALLLWLGIIEKWPNLRDAVQGANDYRDAIRLLTNLLKGSGHTTPAMDHLPIKQDPALRHVINHITQHYSENDIIYWVDQALLAAGL